MITSVSMRTPWYSKVKLSSRARVALVLFVAFGAFIGIYRLLGLPSSPELVEIAKSYYSQHGYWVVFVGALVEGLLLAGWYLPGSLVLALGVVFAREGGLSLGLIFSVGVIGFFLASVINYALGRYGWYRLLVRFGMKQALELMRVRLVKYGLPLIFLTYWHPNVTTLVATAAGVLRLPFQRFLAYSIVALVVWNALWVYLFDKLDPAILKVLNLWLILPILLLWLAIEVALSVYRDP